MLQASLPLTETPREQLANCSTCNRRFAPEGISPHTGRPFRVCKPCRDRSNKRSAGLRLSQVTIEAQKQKAPVNHHRVAFLEGVRVAWQRANGNTEFRAWLKLQIAQPDHVALWDEVLFQLDTSRNNGLFTQWLNNRITDERAGRV